MKVYPLIYSRTKICDYVSGFLVRPYDIDHTLAAKYVGQALHEVKAVGGIRHTVFTVGDYIIYGGTACVTSSLINRILKEKGMGNLDFDYNDYKSDRDGRPITFFIGFAVKRAEISDNYIPKIDLYSTYKIYLSYLKKQWLNTFTETQVLDVGEYIEIGTKKYEKLFVPDEINFNAHSFIENYNDKNYEEVIDYYFYASVCNPNDDFSFLSNVLSDDVDNCTHFKKISLYDMTVSAYVEKSKSISVTAKTVNYSSNNIFNVSQENDETPVIYNVSNISSLKNAEKNTASTKFLGEQPTIFRSTDKNVENDRNPEKKTFYLLRGIKVVAIIAALVAAITATLLLTTHRQNKEMSKKGEKAHIMMDSEIMREDTDLEIMQEHNNITPETVV